MHILCLTHAPFEGPAAVASWARDRAHTMHVIECWHQKIPRPDTYQALVIMGGPMSVLDATRIAWLSEELDWIAAWLEHDRGPTLGICLGSQMLAQIIGGDVHRSPYKEIGWWPVNRTLAAQNSRYFRHWPETVDMYHWHGEMAQLPTEAQVTLGSAGCPVQAFEWGTRTVGLQCHPEMTADSITQLSDACKAELVPGKYIQTDWSAHNDIPRIQQANHLLFGLLDSLIRA